MKLDRIAIGMDFGAPAVTAAHWVAHHFAPQATLVLVHAITVPEPPAMLRGRFPRREMLVETARVGADRRLQELAAELQPSRVEIAIRVGHPVAEIADAATVYDADLVVVGKHGERPGLWNRLGTTAEGVLRAASVPVLLAAMPRERRPQHILVPVTDTPATPWMLSWAGFLGACWGANVTLLHVISSSVISAMLGGASESDRDAPAWESARRTARGETQHWLSGLEMTGLPPSRMAAEVTFGEPGQEILAAAHRLRTDLIVLGCRRHRAVQRAIFGSTTSEVLRGAECPVLAVPEPRGNPEREPEG
ncbi:MAG: universal stress protein [Gemmatimonadaceae bacterium]|nr:universal stress protein [Gemmatimonadaceae bacterium]